MIRQPETPSELLGFFIDARDTPAHDPGLDVSCPVCAKRLSRPMITTSFLVRERPTRSYFFRAHKECWNALDDREQWLIEGAFVDQIARGVGKIVPLYDENLDPIED